MQKLDEFAIGGRFSGLIKPIDKANTIKGSDRCPSDVLVEQLVANGELEKLGIEGPLVPGPGLTGPGVEVAQIGNVQYIGALPRVLLKPMVGGEGWLEEDDERRGSISHGANLSTTPSDG